MRRSLDEKVHVLPSTTRKGTTLSTSAALDSPFVMSQLITPTHVTRTVIFAESENTSDNFDDASTMLDESGSLGPFLDATLAKSRQLKNAETTNENPLHLLIHLSRKIILVMILLRFMWSLMML